MIHLQFFYYLAVLLSGWTTLTAAFRAWRHSGKRAALFFTLVILAFWLIQLELILQLYGLILKDGPALIGRIQNLTDTAAVSLLLIALPALAKTSLGIPLKGGDKVIALAAVSTLIILKEVYRRGGSPAVQMAGIGLLYGISCPHPIFSGTERRSAVRN